MTADKKTVIQATQDQRGFTFVELAMVLVIIGLLIGGVLKGQELVAQARVKSTMSAVDEIRAATQTFRDKYNALPGDFLNAQAQIGTPNGINWGTNCNGANARCDGDGIIEGGGASTETVYFWQHLASANLIKGVQIADTPVIAFGAGLPSAPLAGGFTVENIALVGKTANWIRLGTSADNQTGLISSLQAQQLDVKTDDGQPGSGSVRMNTPSCTQGGGAVTTSSTYNTTLSNNCLVSFEF